ncbi:ImuA family protein [Cypionkella sp. TWP1-2-1b2]|uniref:ImuA family protein n=1 Tax=Cypionkella sp. TWP1-2-1b2 TaxID=2804675 RepID=UPI003CF1F03D
MKTHFEPTHGDPLTLVPARVHEAQGRGRRAFALFQAARISGVIVWIMPTHIPELPFLGALPSGINERLHLFRTKGETDLLWSVEEALRSPAVSLVIAEPQQSLSLTAGRRLQLAAETGQTRGIMLIRDDAGSNAAESRWLCEAAPSSAADSTLHRWSLIKNKKGTLGAWVLDWNGTSSAFTVVSEARERHQPAQASG